MSDSERVPLMKGDSERKHAYVKVPFSGNHHSLHSPSAFRENETYEPHTTKRRHQSSHSEKIDPISLTWEDVNVYVKTERKKCCGGGEVIKQKQILRNVTGMVKPGTLLAIIGASGAGKSTLMNVLTGRNVVQYIIDGSIRVNGVEVGKGIQNISAYCQQDELFMGTLTVREHLIFRALLRMDKSLSKKARLQRVEEVILEMGLSNCAETRIGVPGRTAKGISGGEMKRLSFGSEVLTNPPLMFCDEPTSGLDSFMAQNVVQTLQNMASKGRTILCTIHQPSSQIFAMFDEVLVMAEGRTAFMGASSDAYSFFERQGYPCPKTFNPADFYILTMAIVPGKEPECRDKVERLCDAFSQSDIQPKMRAETEDIKYVTSSREEKTYSVIFEDAFRTGNDRYQTSWLKQFSAVFWRSWINIYRNVELFQILVIQTVFLAVMLGLTFLRQKYDQEGVMNISGVLYIILIQQSIRNIFAVLHTFPKELAMFMREYGDGLYRVDVYYLAKTFAELPPFILLPWLFVAVLYWMIGLYNDVVTFLVCSGVVILVANTAVSLGYLLSTLTGSVDIALAIASPIFNSLTVLGGLFINNGSIPVYFIWLKYLSWFHYANEVLSVNQWENVDSLECDSGLGNGKVPPMRGSGSQRCFHNGKEVLNNLNFSQDNVLLDVSLLCALLVGFRFLSFLVLLIKARRSKS